MILVCEYLVKWHFFCLDTVLRICNLSLRYCESVCRNADCFRTDRWSEPFWPRLVSDRDFFLEACITLRIH